MKRILAILLALCLLLGCCACDSGTPEQPEAEPVDIPAIIAAMTLRQKAEQMVQADENSVVNFDLLKYSALGSLLSTGGGTDDNYFSAGEWSEFIDGVQETVMAQGQGVPMFYGIDAVHGINKIPDAVIFPHNIGVGAANDPDLAYQMGAAVAEEMKLAKLHLAFAPCVALADDPRWGRTYESFSSDVDIVTSLATAYSQGMLEHGVQPCAKHYIGDGATEYGTSWNGMIDQGDAVMDDAELEKLLEPYRAQVEAGVNFIMPSYSSINGTKNHANKYLLTDVLRGELGFEGIVLSDYEAINGLGASLTELNVAEAVNAGVDMLMGGGTYGDYIEAIVWGVENDRIPMERVDEAVTRILTVKQKMGLLDDPYWNEVVCEVAETGSDEYRAIAKELVSSSLVLLKNDNEILPLASGSTVLLVGPAAHDVGVQCGGWTGSWSGQTDALDGRVTVGTSVLEGFNEYAEKYDLTVLTDVSRIDEADVVILCVGEKPYQEYYGDCYMIDLVSAGGMGLEGNLEAMKLAHDSGKPTVTLIFAGRQVMISDLIDNWDAAVMCYLPGSEGDGVVANLVGEHEFTGRLPMPWYRSVEDIGAENPELLFELGYGLEA